MKEWGGCKGNKLLEKERKRAAYGFGESMISNKELSELRGPH